MKPRILRDAGFSVVTTVSRLILAFTIAGIAVLGFVLLLMPALAALIAIEWARARRWLGAKRA